MPASSQSPRVASRIEDTDAVAHAATSGVGHRGSFPWVLLLPALVLALLFLVLPLGLLGALSLKQAALGTLGTIFRSATSLQNYRTIFSSESGTWSSIIVTVEYVAGSTFGALILGLLSALLLNKTFPVRRLFRTLILVPWAVPGVTATAIFVWIMSPSFGVLNYALRSLHLIHTQIEWFYGSRTALIAVMIPTIWKTYPFFTLVLLAGLQAVPTDLYSAAAVDGASSWNQFRFVTWPELRRFAAIATIFNAMSVFRDFDYIFASTQGGPGTSTETLAIRVYNDAFASFNLTLASALGFFTFVIVALIVALLIWRRRRAFGIDQ